jgi:copper chaperone
MVIHLSVENMTCGGCVRSITRAVQNLDPKAQVIADIGNKRVRVDSTANDQAILQAVGQAGFPARTIHERPLSGPAA